METDTKFNRLRDYLNNMEVYPDETEMEDIIALAIKQDSWEANKGYRFERTAHNPREMAFYEQWLKENEPRAGINHGNGILQDLFIERTDNHFGSKKWVEVITNRDRYIVATIIQWLGTNVGMSFLHEALRKFNARIVEERNTEPLTLGDKIDAFKWSELEKIASPEEWMKMYEEFKKGKK